MWPTVNKGSTRPRFSAIKNKAVTPINSKPSERAKGKKETIKVAKTYSLRKKSQIVEVSSKAEKCSVSPEKMRVKYCEQVANMTKMNQALGKRNFKAMR